MIDQIISQLVKVKNEKWGNPVKLDQKAIKYLIDEFRFDSFDKILYNKCIIKRTLI